MATSLRQMRPGFTMDNWLHAFASHFKHFRQAINRPLTGIVELSDSKDVVIRQLRCPMFFAARPIPLYGLGKRLPFSSSTFFPHVGIIFCNCTDPKMTWVAARTVVTGMTNKHPVRDRAARKLIGQSVGLYGATLARRSESPIAVTNGSSPRPASIITARLINFGPEPGRHPLLRLRSTNAMMMTSNEPNRLPLDPSLSGVGDFGDGSGVPATTLTQSVCIHNRHYNTDGVA